MTVRPPIRARVSQAVIVVLLLIAGCGFSETTLTAQPPDDPALSRPSVTVTTTTTTVPVPTIVAFPTTVASTTTVDPAAVVWCEAIEKVREDATDQIRVVDDELDQMLNERLNIYDQIRAQQEPGSIGWRMTTESRSEFERNVKAERQRAVDTIREREAGRAHDLTVAAIAASLAVNETWCAEFN